MESSGTASKTLVVSAWCTRANSNTTVEVVKIKGCVKAIVVERGSVSPPIGDVFVLWRPRRCVR